MPNRSFIAVLTLLASGVVMAQAYKWVDADGIVHYSDRPQEGAEQIELPRYASQPARRTAPRTVAPQAASAATSEPGPTAFQYENFSISTPAAEETLWNIEGVLNVSLTIQPALQTGHQVRVYFDGEARMITGSSFQLEEVYRGVHNLQAEIVDSSGKLMIRSRPNRFYVQQNAIGG